jgi:tRNA modification GTPase
LTNDFDTIAAIATPVGEGGISVIRVSGPEAFTVADRCFRGKVKLGEAPSHTAHFGQFVDEANKQIDEVVAITFRGPHSYTGEDVVEIGCHGGMFVTRSILSSLLNSGAKIAKAGEFTKRAFLNGRLDLLQAEAVADLIHARSDLSLRSSIAQLQGRLSKQINDVREKLVDTIGLLELELDFAEDGYEFVERKKAKVEVDDAIGRIGLLLDTYRSGKIHRDGVKVVLAGEPNVGKSSLLNLLLNEDRAIVTEIPGTTRDIIEENITIDGVLFRVTDTAGLRYTDDVIEREGVARTRVKVEESDLVLLVLDTSRPVVGADSVLPGEVVDAVQSGAKACVIALNKIDLNPNANGEILRTIGFPEKTTLVRVSALTGYGMSDLKAAMVKSVLEGRIQSPESSVLVTNIRHFEALKKAHEVLRLVRGSLEKGESSEFVAVDLRIALDSLGEITGKVTTDDILESIFSRFCVGK